MQPKDDVDLVESLDKTTGTAQGVDPLQFTEVTYDKFKAEFAQKGDNLVFHFYATPAVNAGSDPWKYWKETFPACLSQKAMDYFQLQYPHLRAAYTDEVHSWWMQANGVAARVLDPASYAAAFLDTLEDALPIP